MGSSHGGNCRGKAQGGVQEAESDRQCLAKQQTTAEHGTGKQTGSTASTVKQSAS